MTACLILFVCGLIADYIMPHIKAAERYIDSLPLIDCQNEGNN